MWLRVCAALRRVSDEEKLGEMKRHHKGNYIPFKDYVENDYYVVHFFINLWRRGAKVRHWCRLSACVAVIELDLVRLLIDWPCGHANRTASRHILRSYPTRICLLVQLVIDALLF